MELLLPPFMAFKLHGSRGRVWGGWHRHHIEGAELIFTHPNRVGSSLLPLWINWCPLSKKCLWRAAQIGRNEPKCLEGALTVYPFIKMAAIGLPHWGLWAPRTWDFERIYSTRYPDINSLLWNRPQVQLESGCSPYNNHCLHCSNEQIMPGRSVWHARPSIS